MYSYSLQKIYIYLVFIQDQEVNKNISTYCYYNFVLFPWLDWTLLLMTWLTLLLYYQFDTYTNKSSCSSIKTKNISFANYTSTSF